MYKEPQQERLRADEKNAVPASDQVDANVQAKPSEPSDCHKTLQPDLTAVQANLPDCYQDVDVIGEGGMGAVFKVIDRRLGKAFAIKMLRLQLVQDRAALRRFESRHHVADVPART